jgi:hypothetical protein
MATWHKIKIESTEINVFYFNITPIWSDMGEVFMDYNTGDIYSFLFENPPTYKEVEIEMLVKYDDYILHWFKFMNNNVWILPDGSLFQKQELTLKEDLPLLSNLGKVYYIQARGYIDSIRR